MIKKKAASRTRLQIILKWSQNMRYFEGLLGESAFYLYLCRRICVIMTVVLSHKVGKRYVYTRKRKLDKLPLGRF